MAAVMERFVRIFCLSGFRNKLFCQQLKQASGLIPVRHYSDKIIDPPYLGPSTPNYKPRVNEPLELKRSRLLYQSRKRGMLENGLLLSTFANKHLDDLNEELLDLYDKVINQPSNDWDLYYWMTEYRPTPEEYDNDVMDMLKKHAKNEQQDVRIRQPDLKEKERQ